MSRIARYIRSVTTGYGLLVVNTAYSLATVPLALHYLGAKTFGLWALTTQIGMFMQLADVGMTGALARILIDYKDDRFSDAYRQTFYTMWLVMAIIGISAGLLLSLLSSWIIGCLAIPPEMTAEYQKFLICYAVIWAVGFANKIFDMIPFIHQRSDISNVVSSISMILGFCVIWWGFTSGWGLWSFLAGLVASQTLTSLLDLHQSHRLGLLPARREGRKLSRNSFREVFTYGKDRFLITLGHTALQGTPTFFITRFFGLDANATWSVGTKMSQLAFQLISRLSDLSYPVLAEMHVRGEMDSLRKRFKHLLVAGMAFACFCGAGIAVCNRDFVTFWTRGNIIWHSGWDLVLAACLLAQVLQKFLYVPIGISRNLKGVRFMYLIETAVIAVLLLLVAHFGKSLVMVLVVISAASLMVSIPVCFHKSAQLLEAGIRDLLSPLWTLFFRTVLPLSAVCFFSLLLPPAGSWVILILRAIAIAGASAMFILMIPEIGEIGRELIRRFRPSSRRAESNP